MSQPKKPLVVEDVEDEVEDVEEEEEEEEDDQVPAEASEEEKKVEDIRNPDVVTKYRTAADIANAAVKEVMKAAVPGAKVFEVCALGDKYITDATAKIYRQGKVSKGVGFPTCLSVNQFVGSVSPLNDDNTVLAEGDMVKVDLGVQVDGYVSQVAHTFVVAAPVVEGRKADVLAAAYTAAEAVIRMLKPGVKNHDITALVDKVAKEFHVTTVQGVFSHQVKRYEIDAEKVVANNIPDVPLTGDNKTKDYTIDANETWALDFVMSTGTGKPAESTMRTTVYKRAADETYSLKMKASRAVLSEIDNKFSTFPFSIRALEFDEKKMKFGVVECYKHRLLEAYPVLTEKQGEFVAHIKFTALLLPSGTVKITGIPIDLGKVKSQYSVQDPELKTLLAKSTSKASAKSKAKKKKQKAKKAAGATPAPAAAPAK